ncbi:universal stress protein [Streptomyces sp. WMMC500]|uniref:universal stress protein n=1 Tax=Streptomyces sp. WMMC500 TaxID=3015154 RepID=UPI00248CE805|nr:universal stress protein [Streptomyces sp. WMMC500]WBB61958.1 universal stress protein [Streptomyces sp. WMMC500]
MIRPVVAGIDGSPESLAAADWAAREAQRRGAPLSLVQSWEWPPRGVPELAHDDSARYHAERVLRTTEASLRSSYPGLAVAAAQSPDLAVPMLLRAAEEAEVLALGSRGLGGLAGFLLGSVGLATVARAACPVVLVRSDQRREDEHEQDADGPGSAAGRHRRVVVGVGFRRPCDPLLEFAFDAAARRRTSLLAVNGWRTPLPYSIPLSGPATQADAARMLAAAVAPWRRKYPEVRVIEDVATGSGAGHLLDVAADASLLVVGRRISRPPFGTRLGPIAHAVLHHAHCPVAVVPYD